MNRPDTTHRIDTRAMQEAFDADGIRARLRLLRQPGPHGDPSLLAGTGIVLGGFALIALAVTAIGG